MIELALPALAVVVLAALLWRKERQLESVLAASELARTEQAKAAAAERKELLVHVQAPEAAPYMPTADSPAESLHIAPDDWEAFEAHKENLSANPS